MRAALFFLLVLGLGAAGCTHANCTSTNADIPNDPVRFAVSLHRGTQSQIALLKTVSAVDGAGAPLRDANGHPLLDPDVDPASAVAAHTVAPIESYSDRRDMHAITAQIWIDQSTRWTGIRGLGIGREPYLPPGPAGGAFVSVGTATSVVHFTLGVVDTMNDAGSHTGDAGPPPPQRSHTWEFPFPAPTTPPPSGTDAPVLGDLVVVPRYLPNHDLAVVTRTVVSGGGGITGGELFVLDIDDPAHVISLATVSLESLASSGLHAAPAALAYVPYSDSDGLLFVAIDHQSFGGEMGSIYGQGLVAVVDVGMRSVRTVLRMPTLTNCTQITPYLPPTRTASDPTDPGEDRRMVVTCGGSAAMAGEIPSDAGFVYIEYDPAHFDQVPAIAQTITASSQVLPRPDGGTVPLFGHWVAYVSHGSIVSREGMAGAQTPDRIIAANLDTGEHQILASTLADNGTSTFGFGRPALDPASGVLVVPNGLDGVLTWQVPRTAAVTERTTGTYQYPGGLPRAVTSCSGHLPARVARAIGGTAAIAPTPDAGMPDDAAVGNDAGTDAS